MGKYIKTTAIFFGVWFIASILNGLLSGITIVLFEGGLLNGIIGAFLLSVVFSFLLSVPMVGLVWFVAIMAMLAEKKGNDLFQFVLGTAFICSLAGTLIFIYTLGTEFMKARYFTGLCIIISAMASILLFRKKIKTNE